MSRWRGLDYEISFSSFSTFAELTDGSIEKIAAILVALVGKDLSECTLFDAGCGRGRFALDIAENLRLAGYALKCVVGMEYDSNLHIAAQASCRTLFTCATHFTFASSAHLHECKMATLASDHVEGGPRAAAEPEGCEHLRQL